MAQITLAVGEEFAHEHRFPTTTTLIGGQVRVRVGNGEQEDMILNEEMAIPADTEHVFVNIGDDVAKLVCLLCQPPI